MDAAAGRESERVERVLERALSARKYRTVHRGLARAIAAAELAKGRSIKEAVKETKNRLHQAAAVYARQSLDYDAALLQLQAALASAAGERGADRRWMNETARPLLRRWMAAHTSTYERLPFLDTFYQRIFLRLPPIRSVVDAACGLHPLARPWMPLPPDVPYTAFDLFADQIDFLGRYFGVMGYAGAATQGNALEDWRAPAADLVFLLKTLPCLERIERGAGRRLLHRIDAPVLVVSFPNHSLGGRKRGMERHYASYLAEISAGGGWQVEPLAFPSEQVYILRRQTKLGGGRPAYR